MGNSGSSKLRLFLDWMPAMLGVAMIAGESTATMSAENTSHWLLPIWIHLFGAISAAHWAEVHFFIRKSGHVSGYGLVSVAFFHGWRSSLPNKEDIRALSRRAALLAIGSILLLASADEYHQRFLPGRQSSAIDVAIDVCGAIGAQIIVLMLLPIFMRKTDLCARRNQSYRSLSEVP